MAARLTLLALAHPRLVWIILVIATIGAGFGMPRLQSVSYLEGNVSRTDPEWLHYEALQRDFGSDRLAILVIGCGAERPCRSVFEPEVLDLLEKLTSLSRSFPAVQAVSSLVTATVLVREGDSLRRESLGENADPRHIERFRATVLEDPLLPGTIVSRDLRTTAVVVRFDPTLGDTTLNRVGSQLLGEAREVAHAAGFTLHISGDVAFTSVTDGYVREDLARLTPLMFLVVAVLLALIFRELSSVALALAAVGLPILWTFGLMGWTGRVLSPVSSMLPVLIVVIGVTDAVHFLVRVTDLREGGGDLRDVIRAVAEEVGPPTTMTAVTGALGFLALLTGRIPGIRDFGLFAAIGIALAWALTFVLIPLVLMRLRPPARRSTPPAFVAGSRVLEEVRRFGHVRARAILFVLAGVSIVSLYGVSRLVAENDSLKIIGPEDPLFRSNRFIEDRLRPTATLEVVYEPVEGVSLLEPATLGKLEAIERLLLDGSGGAPVASVLPILRAANREIGTGDLALPRTREASAQLLLLAELADPDAARRVVTPDQRVARFSGAYAIRSGDAIEADLGRIRKELGEVLDGAGTWFVTGSILLSAHLGDLVLDTQITSFASAFLTIFAVIAIFIRSFRLAVVGMIPNVVPIIAVLGVMGLIGINLDVATAMIASILLGISVDDTIYFLVHYKRARTRGVNVRDSVAYTFAIAGKPALFCTAVLASGFFVLGLSRFQSLAVFGLLAGFSVVMAAIAELLVMPAVLEVTEPRAEEE